MEWNLFSQFKQTYNDNVVFHTTYGKFVYILYGQKFFFHTTYRQLVHMLYGLFFSIKRMENLSICFINKLYIYHIEKDMPDYTEKIHNESIDFNYLTKIYTNIPPIGHDFPFTEHQNLPYSVLLGLTPPWNIVITTKYSGWGSSYVFIKYQNSDNSHQNNDLL